MYAIRSYYGLRNDQLFCEEYFWGYQTKDLHPLESVTKSITSLLIGIAIDQGKITGTDERIADIFPEIRHSHRITSYNVCYTKLLRFKK